MEEIDQPKVANAVRSVSDDQHHGCCIRCADDQPHSSRATSMSDQSPFQTQMTQELAPTIEEVLRECDNAWEHTRALRGAYDFDSCDTQTREVIEDDIYTQLATDHYNLNQTYPIILAVMATGVYQRKVAKRFFQYVREHPWQSREEFYDIQSVYSGLVYRYIEHGMRRVTMADIATIRERTREALREHAIASEQHIDRIKKLADENNKTRAQIRAREMQQCLHIARAVIVDQVQRDIIISVDD